MEQSIAAKIDDSYSAKGEALETLKSFHRGESANLKEGMHFTKYALCFQIVFPIVVMAGLSVLFYHVLENNNLINLRRERPPENLTLNHPEDLVHVPANHQKVVINLQKIDANLKALLGNCEQLPAIHQRAAVDIDRVDANIRKVAENLQQAVEFFRHILPEQAATYIKDIGDGLQKVAGKLVTLLDIKSQLRHCQHGQVATNCQQCQHQHRQIATNCEEYQCQHNQAAKDCRQCQCQHGQVAKNCQLCQAAMNRHQIAANLQLLATYIHTKAGSQQPIPVNLQPVVADLKQQAESIQQVLDPSFLHHINNARVSYTNMNIVIVVVCAYTFVIYVFVLDCLAVGYRNERVKEIIYFDPKEPSTLGVEFQMEYSVPILMLIYDILILFIFTFAGCLGRFGLRIKWYYLLLAPLACIVTHSYHILISFIHTPHHATSILIFYGIVVIVFIVTLRTAYHTLHKLVKWLETCFGKKPTRRVKQLKTFFDTCCQGKCAKKCRPCCHSCCSLEWRRCGTEHRWPHPCVLSVLCLISFLLAGFMVYIIILFILIPINNAIDDAPDRLLSINQTALIFFGAAITYKLYRDRKHETVLDYFVKAQDKFEKQDTDGNGETVAGWQTMKCKDKKIEMASRLLGIVNALSNETVC